MVSITLKTLDAFVGILYLEVPYKYKSQKKFKIEDWFELKNPDQRTLNSDLSALVWVVLKYNSNCRLGTSPKRTLAGEKQELAKSKSPNKDLGEKIKDINKEIKEHGKEGFAYLEDVERRIRDRRRRNVNQIAGASSRSKSKDKGGATSPAKLLANTMTHTKALDLGVTGQRRSKSPRKLPQGKAVTPDDLYSEAGGAHSRGKSNVDAAALNKRMADDYAKQKEELAKLRNKVKGLEEGQMTVDNLQLSKQLEAERDDINKERAKLLKEYAIKNDGLDQEKDRVIKDEEKRKKEIEDALKRLREREAELDKLQAEADDKAQKLSVKESDLDTRESSIRDIQDKLDQKDKELEDQKRNLADYAIELDELKDRLLRERSTVMDSKGKAMLNQEQLERDLKDLEKIKKDMEKQKKDFEKEKEQMKKDFAEKEEKLSRERDALKAKLDDAEAQKKNFELKTKQTGALGESLEDANIQLWKEKNKLAQDIKEFMADKKKMESDLRTKKMELEEQMAEFEDERKEMDEEREDIEKMEQDLEDRKADIEARERKLVMDREDFNNLKKKFIEGIMQSGSYDKMTPEMKKMAKDLGVDIDELMEEDKRIKERKGQLEELKKQNEEQL